VTLRHLLGCACALLALPATAGHADQAAFSAKARSLPGLIGYWAWEGNYEDQSGMGNHAQANGDLALIKFGAGVKGGQAVELDNETADSQYLSVAAPVGGTFDTPQQTVLVWAKSTGTPTIGDWENILDRASLWYIDTIYADVDGETLMDFVARIYTPSQPASAGSGQLRSGGASTPVYTAPEAWGFYGFSYDGQVMTLYVDGKAVNQVNYGGGLGPTSATPATAPTGNYDLFWGAWRGEPDNSLHGAVDDTVIYNRALTPEEVKALYDAMMQEPAPPAQ
jgi:hypothetical protein